MQESGCREMKANYGSVGVNGAPLTRAVEALAALLLSALLRTLVSQIHAGGHDFYCFTVSDLSVT